MSIKPGDQVIISTNITGQSQPIEGTIFCKKNTRVRWNSNTCKFENIPNFIVEAIDGCKYTACIDDLEPIDEETKTA